MNDILMRGPVDWSGDNPFIYLKEDASGPWTCLALYFRIAVSDFGIGKVMLVLENPSEANLGRLTKLCLTDNRQLAKYLIDNFVKFYGLFRPFGKILDEIDIVDNAHFLTDTTRTTCHVESASAADHSIEVSLIWEGLKEPFIVDVPPEKSQTSRHEMFCVFQPVSSAQVLVGGRKIPGGTVSREFYHGIAQSAALAHSETWIRKIVPSIVSVTR